MRTIYRHVVLEFGEFPWMVAILLKPEPTYIGGGSLLAPNIVLTAAHKVDSLAGDRLLIPAGEWDLATNEEIYPHIDRNVSEILIHDNYSKAANANNIALLVLELSLSHNPHISPICLPTAPASVDVHIDHANCIAMGWGRRSRAYRQPVNVLKELTIPLAPLHESYLYVGGKNDINACVGDGGAPLVCPTVAQPNRYYQIGIVAWGLDCNLGRVPAVYSNVSYLMPWLSQQLNRLRIDPNIILYNR
ncbi:phenoloxidase-activating factor 2-like [Drosophila navojoa]|uniref:phenoloxidase-activating factor 2-like n=1 Tax=Drosophila navojoa TaxID=7232 RepID=UPI0008474957|nr:phenoloxidase-activating factor 2-like [Drosophila navojoa]